MQLEQMTREQLLAHIAQQAKAQERALSCKLTAKKEDGTGTDGAISVYGLGRFPVTLYAGQWERLEAYMPTLRAFITANADKVSRK